MKKTGRKLKSINAGQVEKLASYGCTNCEIADFFSVDEATIRKRFSENIAKGRNCGKIRLRKIQFEKAMRGNVPMLIWLGKNILGQQDKQEIEHSGSINQPYGVLVVKEQTSKQEWLVNVQEKEAQQALDDEESRAKYGIKSKPVQIMPIDAPAESQQRVFQEQPARKNNGLCLKG